MRVLKAAEGEVLDLAFSPEGHAIAAAVYYQGVFLWNLEMSTPASVRLRADGGYSKGGLGFSADGRSLSWVDPRGLRIYNRDTRETKVVSFAVTKTTHGVFVSANGIRAVSRHGLPDNCLVGWCERGGNWVRDWQVSTAELSVESIRLSPDGRLFAMFTRPALGTHWWQLPRRVEVRDGATAALRAVGEYPYNYACPLMFSPDGRQLVGVNHMTLLAWAVSDAGVPIAPRLVRNDSRKHFTAMAYHPSGRQLYATSNDTTVHVFDTANWNRVSRFTWRIGRLKAIAVSPDGTLAAVGDDAGNIVVWDVDL